MATGRTTKVKLSIELLVERTDGPSIPADDLRTLVADEISDNLPDDLYLTGFDNDEETSYTIVDATVSSDRVI